MLSRFKPNFVALLTAALLCGAWACSAADEGQVAADVAETASEGDWSLGHTFVFADDTAQNKWAIAVFHPTAGLVKTLEVPELAERTAKKAKELQTEDTGPGWSDVVLSKDQRRIFANAENADALVVIDVKNMAVERVFEFEFGDRPFHSYLPNDGVEVWIHLDGKGAFFVLDSQTGVPLNGLGQLVSCTSPEVNQGHGKLLYGEGLGDKYFCTNSNEPAAFVLDAKTRAVTQKIPMCGTKPQDDPNTPEDESAGPLKGGTHDKAYLPGPHLAAIQCLGSAGYSFINPDTMAVVEEGVDIVGGIAHSPDSEYVFNVNTTKEQVQVWDASDPEVNGHGFDFTLKIGGEPSAKGTQFRQTSDHWQAWVPQTGGSDVAVVNLATRAVTLVEIGASAMPGGALHLTRKSALGRAALYTHAAQRVLKIDYQTFKVTPLLGDFEGALSQMIFVDPDAQ